LEEFRAELAALRVEARRPVPEFLGEVIRRIGIVDELEADADRATAAQRSRNLAAFLDQVHAFEPVEGELTLRAFLDYIDSVEALDKEEWAPVQPSDADSVKVMTIHQAKGLEFDHVFVPGVAAGLMPSKRIQQNPAERGYSLDFELRGDAAILPAFDGVLSHFKRDLQAQEVIEERRTMYVALTRARRSLHVSASNWYGENVKAKGPSEFFAELAEWGTESEEATVTISVDPGRAAGDNSEPEQNPMLGYRESLVRDWPGPARPDDASDQFPDGWRRTAVAAIEAGAVQTTLVEALKPDDRATFEHLAADRRQLAAHLRDREAVEGGPSVERTPSAVGASDLITYTQCPKRFYWSRVRPLPRFSGPAARIGTEVHAWIERRARGQGQLLEIGDRPDLTDEELAGDPGRVERLRDSFLASRFAPSAPLYAERAFLLRLGEFT
ncbi:MAG: ATP-dependent DNA helicase, partial [Actinomycetota bacterium]